MPRSQVKNKTVFVGLSGGVDSSVSAYLLKKQGFTVVGAFIKTWQPDWMACTWKEERRDAMRAAAHLEIPFVTIDLEKEYKEEVADYMIREYKAGRTPNPDVMCNKEIKFGAFLNKALSMGADFVATGHYAQVEQVKSGKLKVESEYRLIKAVDKEKEQSYFLYTLRQWQLSKILFPIGSMTKSEVRKIAQKIHLPNAVKKDSQGICFLGNISMKEFLSHYIPENSGDVVDKFNRVIGYHDGAVFYTIGERHGFIVTRKTDHEEPLYIIAKDIQTNTLTVGTKNDLQDENGRVSKKIIIENSTWVNNPPETGKKYQAQIRYHQDFQTCTLKPVGNTFELSFQTPQTSASGQSVVIYDRNTCLGGGIIK